MGTMLDLYRKGNYVDNPYKNFYEIKARDLNKNLISMDKYQDKILLVVNFCPFNKDVDEGFKNLDNLLNKIENKDKNFEILAFPSCETDNLEVSDKEMKEKIMQFEKFKQNNKYNIFNRVYMNGPEIAEVYKYCLRNSKLFKYKEGKSELLNQNFSKFLINKKGKVYNHYGQYTIQEDILEDINKLLKDQFVKNIDIRNKFSNYDKYY
jgi:glutathione peroxidase